MVYTEDVLNTLFNEEERKMKRKISSILLAVLVLCTSFALLGCKQEAKAPYEVTIEDTFIATTYSGDVLAINVEVTNVSNEIIDAYRVLADFTARLDGTSLNMGFISTEVVGYISNEFRLAAGDTETVQLVYELPTKQEGEITLLGITYAEKGNEQIEIVNETLDLAEIERMVVESDYSITVDDVVKTDDGEGGDLLIVDMTFTNDSEEATSFSYALELEIFQNGTQLKTGWLPYNHPADDMELESNARLDIQGGNTIKVREVYTLNDANAPIEVRIVEPYTYNIAPLFEAEIQIQ